MRITYFCFLMELIGIGSIGIQYLLNGMTPGVYVSMGFLLCAYITYIYAHLQEVNK